MSTTTDGLSLGLIETQGLAALIAATDAAVKAGLVEVRSFERASGGLVLTTFVGDVAAVQAAVAAGSEQAAAVGHLVSSHVIPRPDADVWRIVGKTDDPRHDAETASTDGAPGSAAPSENVESDGLDALPVRELRRQARSMQRIGLSGREISRVSKAALLAAMRAAR